MKAVSLRARLSADGVPVTCFASSSTRMKRRGRDDHHDHDRPIRRGCFAGRFGSRVDAGRRADLRFLRHAADPRQRDRRPLRRGYRSARCHRGPGRRNLGHHLATGVPGASQSSVWHRPVSQRAGRKDVGRLGRAAVGADRRHDGLQEATDRCLARLGTRSIRR